MKRYLLRQRLRQRAPRVPRGFSETRHYPYYQFRVVTILRTACWGDRDDQTYEMLNLVKGIDF
jgi:hypothetical protein